MKKTIRSLAISCLLIALAFEGCVHFLAPHPPKENKLIQNFNVHRAVFEQLRDMLQADTNLSRVASWGIETDKPFFLGYPPGGNFPRERFNKYLSLLKEIDGLVAGRGEGKNADINIVTWAWGWAGDSRHICVCWLNEQPTNQISTLDDYPGSSTYTNRIWAFKHLDEHWYLSADW